LKVWGMVLGGYPRGRLARYTLRDAERGTIDYTARYRGLLQAHSEIIGVQKAAGLPVVVDGMVDWHDIFRPFVESWRNVAVDGLLRYFDNNFFYRIPVFTGEPDIREPVLAPRVREYWLLADPAILKVVVPGPVTLSRMARNESELDDDELAERIAYVLSLEVRLAFEAGAGMVQVDEPYLADIDATRDDAVLAAELVSKIVEGYEDRAVLAVYFDAPRKEVYDAILETKTSYISLDITDVGARAVNLVKERGVPGHKPVLGLIDARRIHTDEIERLADLALDLASGADELVLTTTTWLDLIPYRYSLKKTILLGRLVEKVAERAGVEPESLWR